MPRQKTALVFSTAIIAIALIIAVLLNMMPWTSSATEGSPPPEEEIPQEVPVDVPVESEPEEPALFEGNLNRLPLEMIVDMLGFINSPIAGAKIRMSDGQLPNAPRPYRNGTHQGIDYYNGFSGTPISRGTPILAAAEGKVIRIDHDYIEMTAEERAEYRRISAQSQTTPEDILDKFRGRQVWLEHQGKVITRYAHMDTVKEGLAVGDTVLAGDEIGTVGNSGTGPAITGEDSEMHLHFEIWLGEFYLGEGLPPGDVRFLIQGILE